MKIVFEKVVPRAGSSFATLDKRARAFDGRFHFHPEVEITLIEKSSGRRVVGDSIESFAAGDLVLLGENLPHQYVSHPNPARATARAPVAAAVPARTGAAARADAPGSSARAKVIQFRADLLGESLLRLPELKRIATMLKLSRRGLKFSDATAAAARRTITQLFAASGARRLTFLLELLDILSRDRRALPIASAGYLPRISSREGDSLDRALRYLNEKFAEPVTLTDLSRHLHVSPATCNRLFQKSIGRSFKGALIEMRISHAARLLLETDRPIVDIAYASGFANLSNFNRRFKATHRRAPRAYRNQMG